MRRIHDLSVGIIAGLVELGVALFALVALVAALGGFIASGVNAYAHQFGAAFWWLLFTILCWYINMGIVRHAEDLQRMRNELMMLKDSVEKSEDGASPRANLLDN